MEQLVFVHKQQGFAALFAIVVLTAVLLAMLGGLGVSSAILSRNSSDDLFGSRTRSVANACAELGLQAIRDNSSFTGTVNTNLDSGSCSYTVSNTGGSTRAVTVQASVGSSTRRIQISISALTPRVTVSSWQEVP